MKQRHESGVQLLNRRSARSAEILGAAFRGRNTDRERETTALQLPRRGMANEADERTHLYLMS